MSLTFFEPPEHGDLRHRGGDGGFAAQDPGPELRGFEAGGGEGLELTVDPSAFGADGESETLGVAVDSVLDRRPGARMGDQATFVGRRRR